MKTAVLQKSRPDGTVQCLTCAHACLLKPGQWGICRVRQNVEGRIVSHVYGKCIASHIDPIEKKPFFHFMPNATAFSLAAAGCNMTCKHCQNASISQLPRNTHHFPGQPLSPETLVKTAVNAHSKIIAYTYTEPTVFFDYALDTAQIAVDADLKNVFVTNGYLSKQAVQKIAPILHAANVDLKFFTDARYQEICGARLQPVLNCIRLMHELGIWVEVTTLIIPGLNDDESTLHGMAQFLAALDPAIPWHLTRFYPSYRLLNKPVTPMETLHFARNIGIETGLKYVYTGNMPGDTGENTFCPSCKQLVIERKGFTIIKNNLKSNACPHCGQFIDGVWASIPEEKQA